MITDMHMQETFAALTLTISKVMASYDHIISLRRSVVH